MQWAECRTVWLMITHEPYPLTLGFDSWAILSDEPYGLDNEIY